MSKATKKTILFALGVLALIAFAMWLRYASRHIFHSPAVSHLRSGIYVFLFSAWCYSLWTRIVQTQVRSYLPAISALMVLWILLRSIKYSIENTNAERPALAARKHALFGSAPSDLPLSGRESAALCAGADHNKSGRQNGGLEHHRKCLTFVIESYNTQLSRSLLDSWAFLDLSQFNSVVDAFCQVCCNDDKVQKDINRFLVGVHRLVFRLVHSLSPPVFGSIVLPLTLATGHGIAVWSPKQR